LEELNEYLSVQERMEEVLSGGVQESETLTGAAFSDGSFGAMTSGGIGADGVSPGGSLGAATSGGIGKYPGGRLGGGLSISTGGIGTDGAFDIGGFGTEFGELDDSVDEEITAEGMGAFDDSESVISDNAGDGEFADGYDESGAGFDDGFEAEASLDGENDASSEISVLGEASETVWTLAANILSKVNTAAVTAADTDSAMASKTVGKGTKKLTEINEPFLFRLKGLSR
jgi:hypothetical protein